MESDRGSKNPGQSLTREVILDAAEELFAAKGFYGASLREIADLANVNSGLMNYYFGTKDELFRQVVRRRTDPFFHRFKNEIEQLQRDTKGTVPTPYAIIRCYIETVMDLAFNNGKGWSNYMKLQSQAMSAYHDRTVHPVMSKFEALGEELIQNLMKAMPYSNADDLRLNLYFVEAAMIFMLKDGGLLDARTRQRYTAQDLTKIVEPMARFFTIATFASPHMDIISDGDKEPPQR